jgi:hypothetical protein
MAHYTHQTAPTQSVEAIGIRFAYRRFGEPNGVPLVFNQHFRGTMDYWDPAVTDGLAKNREAAGRGPGSTGWQQQYAPADPSWVAVRASL